MKQKTNIERLNELINPETFAFERGADYGKGKPTSSTEITTRKMTDTLDKMVRSAPLGADGMVPAVGGYLGEDALTKKRKDHDIVDKQDEPFGPDSAIQKRIVTFVQFLNDLDPEDRKAAMSKFQNLTK